MPKVRLVCKVRLELPDPQDHRDRLGRRAQRVNKELLEPLVQQALKEQQGRR